jgi:hypothetical protein
MQTGLSHAPKALSNCVAQLRGQGEYSHLKCGALATPKSQHLLYRRTIRFSLSRSPTHGWKQQQTQLRGIVERPIVFSEFPGPILSRAVFLEPALWEALHLVAKMEHSHS